jgi:hypothetical protein
MECATYLLENQAKLYRKKSAKSVPGKNPRKGKSSSRPRLGKGLFSQDFFIRFWDTKLQFWPERLHILNKRGQNILTVHFLEHPCPSIFDPRGK